MSEVKKVNYVSDDVKFDAVIADNEVWMSKTSLSDVLKRHPTTIEQNARHNFGKNYKSNVSLCRDRLPGSMVRETAFSSKAVKDLARFSGKAVLGVTLRKWAVNVLKAESPKKSQRPKKAILDSDQSLVTRMYGTIVVYDDSNAIWMSQAGIQKLLGLEQWIVSQRMLKLSAQRKKIRRSSDNMPIVHYNHYDVVRLSEDRYLPAIGNAYYQWACEFLGKPQSIADQSRVIVATVSEAPEAVIGYSNVACSIGPANFYAIVHNDEAWITQKQMAELFGVTQQTISEHIRGIYAEAELQADSVHRNFLSTASDGKRYDISHYSSLMVQHVGYRVKSERGIEYRKWVSLVVRGEAPPSGELTPQTALAMTKLDQSVRNLAYLVETKVKIMEDHEVRLQALEKRTQEAVEPKQLTVSTSIGSSREKAKVAVLRSAISARVASHAGKNEIEIQDAWRILYDMFKKEYQFDLRKASNETGISKLDVADREGMLLQLYAVAVANFQ